MGLKKQKENNKKRMIKMGKQLVVSGVLATLASVCFVAGVALLSFEGGTDIHGQSKETNIDSRAFDKH